MKLEHYISELLFQHDCVIVPGLGGFVANYKSATIQPIQNTFYPPSKGISFNKNLNSNDGLLANFIAQKENFNYDRALKEVEDAVIEINQKLKLKQRVLLNEIGTLFLDSESRIHFEPETTVNYLIESYGLPVFQKQPIKRATIEEKITKEFKDRTTPLKVVGGRKSSTKKWAVAAAITIPLAFFAIWIPTQTELTANLNYANLNPFKTTEKGLYTPDTSSIDFIEPKINNVKDQIALADESVYFLNIKFDDASPSFVVKLKEKPVAEAVTTYVATNKQNLHYHIVGGCFSEKSNATKLVRKLKKDGFDASIIGKRKGLWTVGYNSFATRKEAVDALAKAKAHNQNAWVLNF